MTRISADRLRLDRIIISAKTRVLGKRTANCIWLWLPTRPIRICARALHAFVQQDFERSTRALTERTFGLLRQKARRFA